ncbi:TRAP transporter permease [Pararhizobium mangrovi]|uniref:TRAP transporter fused permease subunit n=1 Tax=Pararhizobium mangrovi TaxID=2590452 RepID=A0A506UBX2_9HYPH|nr:TRAP transporter fused permease subunit [Pararhizobium mangrovi]TPW30621.1 TRAP transporter fused permease subunit [Pararhizobium mangrovi]
MQRSSLGTGLRIVTRWIAIALAIFHLVLVAGFLSLSTMEVRIVHLGAVLVLAFLSLPATTGEPRGGERGLRPKVFTGVFLLAAAGAIASGIYLYSRWQDIALSGGLTTDLDTYVGLGIVFLVMLAVALRVGLALMVITLLFLLYPLVSDYLPGILESRPYGIDRLAGYLTNSSDGVYGIPIGVSASYIIMFTIFGAFLGRFGASDFFFRLSGKLTRNTRAASAKTAVIFSTLLGMVSGSAAGNVAVTGTMTIPMMKREGYAPHQAGAIEAVVSTGGQIMPPVMGAAAFIMAEIIGRPYPDIMRAALIPALLFFASIFFIVQLQAVKADMRVTAIEGGDLPFLKILLPGLRFIVPFALLISMMVAGYSPFKASFAALIILLVGCFFFELDDMKGFGAKILDALESGAKAVVPIAIACAAAGIIAGVLALSGLGSKISAIIVAVSAGEPLLALLLTMVVALVLGMGLPTTAAYLILATVVAPGLAKMGVPLLTAHMFVFFFGCISTITPPVALASYVAASIAECDINKTSWTAFFYGITSYILPFMFFFSPALLMDGSVLDIARATLTGFVSVFCIATAVVGWLFRPVSWIERGALALAGLFLLYQSALSDALGAILFVLIATLSFRQGRNTAPAGDRN